MILYLRCAQPLDILPRQIIQAFCLYPWPSFILGVLWSPYLINLRCARYNDRIEQGGFRGYDNPNPEISCLSFIYSRQFRQPRVRHRLSPCLGPTSPESLIIKRHPQSLSVMGLSSEMGVDIASHAPHHRRRKSTSSTRSPPTHFRIRNPFR